MAYTIRFEDRASKELERLPKNVQGKVLKAIRQLKADPRPAGCRKLRDREGWRIRIGDYRVIYGIRDEQLLVLVVKVGHRKNIYKK